MAEREAAGEFRTIKVPNPDGTDSGLAVGVNVPEDGSAWACDAQREAFEALKEIAAMIREQSQDTKPPDGHCAGPPP